MNIEAIVIAILCAAACGIGVYFSNREQNRAKAEAICTLFNNKKKEIQDGLDAAMNNAHETLTFHGIPIVYEDSFAILDPTVGAAMMLIDWTQCPNEADFWQMVRLRSGEVRIFWMAEGGFPRFSAPSFGIELTPPPDDFNKMLRVNRPLTLPSHEPSSSND